MPLYIKAANRAARRAGVDAVNGAEARATAEAHAAKVRRSD